MNTIELSEFLCAECKEGKWFLYFGRDENDRVYLIPMCMNCQTPPEKGEQPILWCEFDVTDQLPEEVREQIFSDDNEGLN